MKINDIEITLDPALIQRMTRHERWLTEADHILYAEQVAAYGPYRLTCETDTGTSTTRPAYEAYNSLGQVVMSFPSKNTARAYADAYDLSIRPVKET